MARKIPIIPVICLVLLFSAQALAQSKVDPYLDSLDFAAGATGPGKAMMMKGEALGAADATDYAEVFIKTSDAASARLAVEEAGGSVETEIGSIFVAKLPLESIERIARDDSIIFIEAAKPIRMKNDVAAAELGSSEVHEGAGLPTPLTGKGVIVGLVDTGIDYRHPDFMDESGKSRVLSIWDQNKYEGPAPAEIANSFGTECDSESIADGSCRLGDSAGHGTHVAGTAAGRHPTYGGVAPDANIVAVTYDSSLDLSSGYAETIFSTKICQAAYYVFAKADSLGMPAVVNMSLGTHLGAHDGTSLFEECLSELLRGSAGRAIVAAAGNETAYGSEYAGIHAGFEPEGVQAANFVIQKTTPDRIYYIDIWGEEGAELSFALALRKGQLPGPVDEETGFVAPGEKQNGSFLGGSIEWSINATEIESGLNGKPHVGIRIILGSSVTHPEDLSFDLVVKGTGSFDAWLFPDKPAKLIQFTQAEGVLGADWTFVPGDSAKIVAIPATSPDVIAVGGYTSRNRWSPHSLSTMSQVGYSLGDILDFSSAGPSADSQRTGQKPEITAPGGMVASALASNLSPDKRLIVDDGQHVLQAGTSMAAPFVTGAIALMLSANPDFTHADARRYLTEGAYVDEFVGETVPNDRWGFGKLDILKAVELAIAGGPSGSFNANDSLKAPAEGASGGSSCALSPAGGGSGMSIIIGLMGILPIWIGRRKATRLRP